MSLINNRFKSFTELNPMFCAFEENVIHNYKKIELKIQNKHNLMIELNA
jgi:hypothetical protein